MEVWSGRDESTTGDQDAASKLKPDFFLRRPLNLTRLNIWTRPPVTLKITEKGESRRRGASIELQGGGGAADLHHGQHRGEPVHLLQLEAIALSVRGGPPPTGHHRYGTAAAEV